VAADSVLAVALCGAIVVTCWLSSGVSTHDQIITTVAAVLSTAPITVRRVWPGATLVFSMAVILISTPLGSQLLSNDNAYALPTLVLSYTAGERLDARRSTAALLLSLALGWAWALLPASLDGSPSATAVFYVTMLLVPTWLIGRYVHRHRHRTASFDALAAQAAASREAHEAAAVAVERARIGAELQDIIAHSISAMVIQAGSARLMVRRDPERARSSILAVEETGRQALSDLRRLLGMLRKDEDPRALRPQPGLSQIAALIDSLEGLGLACERHTEGTPVDLTPGVDLVAYRVVEAALQAAAERQVGHSQVTVRYRPRDLELEVSGDGAIPDLDGAVAPLLDRLALYEGDLSTTPRADSFAVQARLPLDPVGLA
jgi:signal transduction histidine kinase